MTLSDKIIETKNVKNTLYLNNMEILSKKHVKASIKELKSDKFRDDHKWNGGVTERIAISFEEIDKIFGKELTE